MPNRCPISRRGFTLIELIIIIVVVSIAIVTLLAALASVVNNTVRPNIMKTATELAEQELERVTATRFAFVCDDTNTLSSPFGSYAYDINVRYVDSGFNLSGDGQDTPTDYKRVIVTISHNLLGSVALTTVVTNRGSTPVAMPCTP